MANPNKTMPTTWCGARLFALFLLDIGTAPRTLAGGRDEDGTDLVLLALTLSKMCIFDEDRDTARIALQKVAEYLETAKKNEGDPQRSQAARQRQIEAEYLLLRIILVSLLHC